MKENENDYSYEMIELPNEIKSKVKNISLFMETLCIINLEYDQVCFNLIKKSILSIPETNLKDIYVAAGNKKICWINF